MMMMMTPLHLKGAEKTFLWDLQIFTHPSMTFWAYLYLLCVSKLLCNFGEQIHSLRLFKTLPTKLPSFESNRSVVIIQIQSHHRGFNGTSILFIAKAFICFHASAQKPSSTVEVEGSSYWRSYLWQWWKWKQRWTQGIHQGSLYSILGPIRCDRW